MQLGSGRWWLWMTVASHPSPPLRFTVTWRARVCWWRRGAHLLGCCLALTLLPSSRQCRCVRVLPPLAVLAAASLTGRAWMVLVQGGRMEVAKYLLGNAGADVNEPCADPSLVTPLYMAVQLDNVPMLQLLLSCGADSNLPNQRTGSSALLFAAERGYLSCCRVLADAGARINAANKAGRTPLHGACWHSRPEVVALLLANGADTTVTSYQVRRGCLPGCVAPERFVHATTAGRAEFVSLTSCGILLCGAGTHGSDRVLSSREHRVRATAASGR